MPLPRFATIAASIALLAAAPAWATEKASKPLAEREPGAVDVVATPVSDLNLKKDEIPSLLIAAQSRPYDTAGLRRCPAIAAAVGELDATLGDDLDVPTAAGGRWSAGRMAQAAVGAFIPFRGVIREISGANAHDRKLAAAVQAGVARRAFLKGYGEARGCRYPARSATPAVVAERTAALAPDKDKQAAR